MEHKMDWQQLLTEKRYNTSNIFYLREESAYNIDSMNIIKSEAFQKLPEKTHLFPLESWDCSRSSMVHSLEVSYFSKMIVHKFAQRNRRKTVTAEDITKMANTVSAAALLQQIGLPAFGYCGEVAMRAWFQEQLASLTYNSRPVVDWLGSRRFDFEALNVHAQSFRIIRRLHDNQQKKLNLTYGILNTVASLQSQNKPQLTYYQSELPFYRNVSEGMTITSTHPLALIVQAASEVSWTTSALKEALGKGIIKGQEIVSYLQEKIDENRLTYEQLYQYREIIARNTHFTTKEGPDDSAILLWMDDLQLRFINGLASSFNRKYMAIMAGAYPHDLFYETDVEPLYRGLKALVDERIICHSQLQESELTGTANLRKLLDRFVPAIIYYEEERDPEQKAINKRVSMGVKMDYLRELGQIDKPSDGDKLYYRLSMAVDFLSGLTDREALKLAKELSHLEATPY